jgi:hypothetical protein
MICDEFYFSSFDQVIKRWNDRMWIAKGRPRLWVRIYDKEGITIWRDVGHGGIKLKTPDGEVEGKEEASVGNVIASYRNGTVELRFGRRLKEKFQEQKEEVSMGAAGATHGKPSKTEEILTRKVFLKRSELSGKGRPKAMIGWELGPPRRGARYTVSLENGMVLRTSPVEEIHEGEGIVTVKTANSIYTLEYLKA